MIIGDNEKVAKNAVEEHKIRGSLLFSNFTARFEVPKNVLIPSIAIVLKHKFNNLHADAETIRDWRILQRNLRQKIDVKNREIAGTMH